MKVRRKITDIFYNIHLSLDIWLCVCLCLALQLKIYYIFYIMAAESTQKFKSTNFYRIIKSFRFAVRKRRIQYEGWSWLVAEEEKSWTMQGWISGNLSDVEVNYPLKCLRKILEDFFVKIALTLVLKITNNNHVTDHSDLSIEASSIKM